MRRHPDFDELLDADVGSGERERLRRVHELLIQAGPPPELAPAVEAGPTLAMTLGRPRRRLKRRVMLLAAALVVVALAFLGGYIAGNNGGGLAQGQVLKLAGTRIAPRAAASLRILPVDSAGNWPMQLSATGLPKLPARDYYAVYLVRNGKPFAPCGTFIVRSAEQGVSVTLNAPYRLRSSDSWIVTRELAGVDAPGPVVLRPLA